MSFLILKYVHLPTKYAHRNDCCCNRRIVYDCVVSYIVRFWTCRRSKHIVCNITKYWFSPCLYCGVINSSSSADRSGVWPYGVCMECELMNVSRITGDVMVTMIWYGMVWYGMLTTMVWYGMVWYGYYSNGMVTKMWYITFLENEIRVREKIRRVSWSKNKVFTFLPFTCSSLIYKLKKSTKIKKLCLDMNPTLLF